MTAVLLTAAEVYAAASAVIIVCWLVMAHRDTARLNRTRPADTHVRHVDFTRGRG